MVVAPKEKLVVIEDVVVDVVDSKAVEVDVVEVVAAEDVVVHSVDAKITTAAAAVTTIQTEDTTITQLAILDLVAMLDTTTTSNHKQLVAIMVVVMAVVMEQTRVNSKGDGIKTKVVVVETDTSPTRSISKAYPTPREHFVFTCVLQNNVARTVVVNTPCTERSLPYIPIVEKLAALYTLYTVALSGACYLNVYHFLMQGF